MYFWITIGAMLLGSGMCWFMNYSKRAVLFVWSIWCLAWIPIKFADFTGYSYVVLQSILALVLVVIWRIRSSSMDEGEEVFGDDEDTGKSMCGKRFIITGIWAFILTSLLFVFADWFEVSEFNLQAISMFAVCAGIFGMMVPVRYKWIYVSLGIILGFVYMIYIDSIYADYLAQQGSGNDAKN